MGLGLQAERKFQALNVKILLDECLDMFEDLFVLKGISVEKDLNGADLLCLGDEFSLEQVFKNLVLNAIEAMEGRPEKQLKVRATVATKTSSMSIDIEDTGCGISEASTDEVFSPYFTTKEFGTGLGLIVVKSVVEKHDGKLSMKSRVGKGTTFTVNLPLITT
jgi:signal transduction histidine kinase